MWPRSIFNRRDIMNFFEWGYMQWMMWTVVCVTGGAIIGIACDRLYHGDSIGIGRLRLVWHRDIDQ